MLLPNSVNAQSSLECQFNTRLFTRREDLDTETRLEIAATALNSMMHGVWGTMTDLSIVHSISRTFIYSLAASLREAGCFVFGYLATNAVFFISFLLMEAKVSWKRSAVLMICATTFLLVLAKVMVLEFPEGLIPVTAFINGFLA